MICKSIGRWAIYRIAKVAVCVVVICLCTWMVRSNSVRKLSTYMGYTTPDVYTRDLRSHESIRVQRTSNHTETEAVLPLIYIVTPSGRRITQKADLTRLSNTLRLVPRIHWIIIEDNVKRSSMVAELLKRSGLLYTHLNEPTPPEMIPPANVSRLRKPRGLPQRNFGIRWLHKQARPPAVVYFADDDNAYDIRLFEEMRYTKRVSVWPTAFTTRQRYQSPIVTDGKVTGWLTSFVRPFSTDMAGFAINLRLFLDHPYARFSNIRGRMETDLLTQLELELEDLEPRADNCTKVLVWHTRTEEPELYNEGTLQEKLGHGTDLRIEV